MSFGDRCHWRESEGDGSIFEIDDSRRAVAPSHSVGTGRTKVHGRTAQIRYPLSTHCRKVQRPDGLKAHEIGAPFAARHSLCALCNEGLASKSRRMDRAEVVLSKCFRRLWGVSAPATREVPQTLFKRRYVLSRRSSVRADGDHLAAIIESNDCTFSRILACGVPALIEHASKSVPIPSAPSAEPRCD